MAAVDALAYITLSPAQVFDSEQDELLIEATTAGRCMLM
jgi:hypothetical protein